MFRNHIVFFYFRSCAEPTIFIVWCTYLQVPTYQYLRVFKMTSTILLQVFQETSSGIWDIKNNPIPASFGTQYRYLTAAFYFLEQVFFIMSPCCECEFGWLERVVRGEVNVEEEHTTCKMKEHKKLKQKTSNNTLLYEYKLEANELEEQKPISTRSETYRLPTQKSNNIRPHNCVPYRTLQWPFFSFNI